MMRRIREAEGKQKRDTKRIRLQRTPWLSYQIKHTADPSVVTDIAIQNTIQQPITVFITVKKAQR